MDLVNSVTQNSNNHNVTMENKAQEGGEQHESQQMSSWSAAAAESGATVEAKASAPPQSSQVPDYLKAIGMDPRKFWPKKYRFTREKPPGSYNPLTIAQRNFYESNGYIVFDDCVNKKLLDTIRGEYLQSEGRLVSEFLMDKLLVRNARLLQYVKCFCDDSLMLMTHRLIDSFQTADARQLIDDSHQQGRQLLFRDWMYLPFRPIDKVCCAITALEPLEHVLLVVPGTHRVGQCTISSTLDNVSAAYDSSQEKGQQTREIFECSPERLSTLVDKSKRGFKYINLKPGQTLIYHPGLIHGFSNDLVNFRRQQLVSVAYYAAADCEYIDLRKWSPGLISDDPSKLGQQPIPISLAHFEPDKNPMEYTSWLDKPRLINGGSNAANL